MFGIGETEFVIICLFGFLLFGPDKLPGAGRTIGRAIKQFRQAEEGFTKVVQAEIVDPIQQAAQAPTDEIAKKAANVASDDDLPEEDAAPEPPAESFAERKARMEAERKAEDAASDEDLPEADEAQDAEKPKAEEEKPEKKPRRSAASLYGLTDDTPSSDESAEVAADGDSTSTDNDAAHEDGEGESSQD